MRMCARRKKLFSCVWDLFCYLTIIIKKEKVATRFTHWLMTSHCSACKSSILVMLVHMQLQRFWAAKNWIFFHAHSGECPLTWCNSNVSCSLISLQERLASSHTRCAMEIDWFVGLRLIRNSFRYNRLLANLLISFGWEFSETSWEEGWIFETDSTRD